jgi:hypothetical protein
VAHRAELPLYSEEIIDLIEVGRSLSALQAIVLEIKCIRIGDATADTPADPGRQMYIYLHEVKSSPLSYLVVNKNLKICLFV